MIINVSAARKGLKRIALGFDFDFNPVCLLEDSFRNDIAGQLRFDACLDWSDLSSDGFRWCKVHEGSRVYRRKDHDGIWALKGHRLHGLDVILLASLNGNGGPILTLERHQTDYPLIWEVWMDDRDDLFTNESNVSSEGVIA